MGGGGFPPDRSVELAAQEARDREASEERERLRKEEELKQFTARLDSAYSSGEIDAQSYFTSRGLDPSQYNADITNTLSQRRGTVPQLDASPGSYFNNVGQDVYNRLTEGDRAKFNRTIDSFAPAGFADRRITNDLDDPIIAGLLEESYATADDYTRNLLDRGVITVSGYEAALGDLDKQRPGANARLQELGLGILEGGRSGLRDLASEARQGAAAYELGGHFNPFNFESDIDRSYTDFFTGLSDTFRAQAPSKIFDTAGLSGVAGAAQGAGNTAFDPNALAGIGVDEEEEDRKVEASIF